MIDAFFNPESVAVIGASSTPGRVGYVMVENLLNSFKDLKIFPLNPHGGEVLGLQIYPSLEEIPEKAELAMIAVGAGAIQEAVEGCVRTGIKAAVIHTPGFAETGEEGERFQQSLVSMAHSGGVRLVGPNTQGLFNLDIGLPLLTVPFSHYLPMRGPVSFVTQTGLFPWEFLLRHPHVGISKMIDLGNMCDVDHAEVVEYFGSDPTTDVIGLHIEGLREGRTLLDATSRVAPQKPVVALKAGRTPGGAGAAASHSGSIAGRDDLFEALFRQTGVFRPDDVDDFCDHLVTFSCLPPVRGKRVGILTTSGAAGTLAADACYKNGLEVVPFSEETIRKVQEMRPGWIRLRNPMDVWQVLEDPLKSFSVALDAIFGDPCVDALAVMTHALPDSPFDTLDILKKFAGQGVSKPTVVWALGSDEKLRDLNRLSPSGLVFYPTIGRAVKALAASHTFHQ